jgi:hypothetical protein
MPYRAGQLLSDYPGLDDQNSLLSRTFQYLNSGENVEATKLWMTEFYGREIPFSTKSGLLDLTGNLEWFYSKYDLSCHLKQNIQRHPLADCFTTTRYNCKRCNRTGGCVGGTNNQTYKGIACQEVYTDKVDRFVLQDNTTADKFLDCSMMVQGKNGRQCTATNCDGNIEIKAVHFDFAHTVVINCSSNMKVSSLTPSFKCMSSNFILRSVILHSEGKKHFVSLNRHANGWILYDGVGVGDRTYRYMNYPTNLVDEAMKTFKFGIAMYETAPENESRLEGNLRGKQGFTDHFAYENYTPSPTPAIINAIVNETLHLDSDSEEDDNSNSGHRYEVYTVDSNSLVNEDQDDDKPNSIAASNSDDNYSAGL